MKRILFILIFFCLPAFAEDGEVVFQDALDTESGQKSEDLAEAPARIPMRDRTNKYFASVSIISNSLGFPGGNTTKINGLELDSGRQDLTGTFISPGFMATFGREINGWLSLFAGANFSMKSNEPMRVTEGGGGNFVPCTPGASGCYPGGGQWVPAQWYDITVDTKYYEIFGGARFMLGEISNFFPFSWFNSFGHRSFGYAEGGLSYNSAKIKYSGDFDINEDFTAISPLFGFGAQIMFGDNMSTDIGLRFTNLASQIGSFGMGLSVRFYY